MLDSLRRTLFVDVPVGDLDYLIRLLPASPSATAHDVSTADLRETDLAIGTGSVTGKSKLDIMFSTRSSPGAATALPSPLSGSRRTIFPLPASFSLSTSFDVPTLVSPESVL